MDQFEVEIDLGRHAQLARHRRDGAHYVLKQVSDLASIRLHRRLVHESISRVYGVFSRPGGDVGVLEHAALGNVIAPGQPIDRDVLLGIVRGALSALAYIHGDGEAHRNIKLQSGF